MIKCVISLLVQRVVGLTQGPCLLDNDNAFKPSVTHGFVRTGQGSVFCDFFSVVKCGFQREWVSRKVDFTQDTIR